MFTRIDHVEIIPVKIEATINFYTEIIGFEIIRREQIDIPPLKEVIFLKLNDSMIELLVVNEPENALKKDWQAGYRMLALEVDDMDKTITYLRDKGVEISWGPELDFEGSKRAEILDPNGFSIELREW